MAEQTKKSIFAQRMEKRRERQQLEAVGVSTPKKDKKSFGERSFVVSGQDAAVIHNENVNKLHSMTEEEIIQTRDKLIADLHPGIVKYLQGLRENKRETNVDIDTIDDTKIRSEIGTRDVTHVTKLNKVEEITHLAHKYPHMDVVEDEKLKWIGELPEKINTPEDPYPARFDFEGRLLPYCDKGEGVLLGLHNHGDEQERPGYSIQELIQLSRSAVLQQRVIAINTLAKIMAKASNYGECFDTPLVLALLEADTFLLLRFSLDDPAQPVVAAASAAICNLIVNHLDEICLDILLGTPLGLQQPSFGVVLDVPRDDVAELKDQELLKLDIVRGALRTDILTRIKYILVDLSTEPVEIKHLLKLLTRIARHSFESADNVFKCPGLLPKVRSLLGGSEGSFYPEALKLYRILCVWSTTFASAIISEYKIFDAIFGFITGDQAQRHPETMQLTLESFYLWQTLLSYQIAPDFAGQLTPVLIRLLDTHYGVTDLNGSNSDLEHGTALVSTFTCIAKYQVGIIAQAMPLILNATRKWLTQYSQHMAKSASKLVGTCLQFLVCTYSELNNIDELYPLLDKILTESCFPSAVKRLRKHSWLIRGKILSCPENLPCLGSVPPTLQEESSLPFIFAFASYLLVSKNKQLIDKLVSNDEIIKYLEEVLKGYNVKLLSGHWYARPEIYLLTHIVHLYTLAEAKENEAVYHRLAFTLITSVQSGDKFLLSDIISRVIFNSKFFRPDVEAVSLKMQELQVDSSKSLNPCKILTKALEDVTYIESTYISELGLMGFVQQWPPSTLMGLLNSTQCALPSDWIFMPILRYYNNKRSDGKAVEVVTRCLQWFIILEELFPDIASSLDVTAKYSRLCCVYLAASDLFRDVTPLLEVALSYIIRSSKLLDFEKPIPGLTSFYDFYREILEQFAFSSFCDRVFGQYVLVPLAQRHHIKYKKLIWSELGAVLRSLCTPLQYVDMESYLEPQEIDPDLLMIYIHGIATGRVREVWCPVLYKVAVHHVSRYVKEKSDDCAESLLTRITNLGNQDLKTLLLS